MKVSVSPSAFRTMRPELSNGTNLATALLFWGQRLVFSAGLFNHFFLSTANSTPTLAASHQEKAKL